MSNVVCVETKLLKAVSLFMAKNAVRYYLNGLFVEMKNGVLRIVATDGHGLSVGYCGRYELPDQSLTIPRDIVDLACKIKSINTYIDLEKRTIAGINFTPVDGVFPDYRRVIPDKVTGETAYYAPEYLVKADKAGQLIQKGKFAHLVTMNGQNTGVLHVENLMVLVMPRRDACEPFNVPWLFKGA